MGKRKDLPTFTPLGNRVLILQADEVEQLDSGLYIPQGAQEKPYRGTVTSVGPGRRLEDGTLADMNVTKGDVVLFGKYSGQEIRIGDATYLVMDENDILGIVE